MSAESNSIVLGKADQLKKEADQILTKGVMYKIISGNNKYEIAIDLYKKAAAQYKLIKEWQKAADCYLACANIYNTKLKDTGDEADMYKETAKALDYVNVSDSIKYYKMCADLLAENNKFINAAKILKEAGMKEEKQHNYVGAIGLYNRALTYYETDNFGSDIITIKGKLGNLEASLRNFNKAIALYDSIVDQSLDSSVFVWQANTYIFKSLLCQFAICSKNGRLDDLVTKVEKFCDICPKFDGTREKKLIEQLIDDYEKADSDKFAEDIYNYDEITKLEDLHVKLLLEVKTNLELGNIDDNVVGV